MCVCLDVHDDDEEDDDGDGMMVNCKRRFLLQKLVFTRVKKSSSLLNSCRFFIIMHITRINDTTGISSRALSVITDCENKSFPNRAYHVSYCFKFLKRASDK